MHPVAPATPMTPDTTVSRELRSVNLLPYLPRVSVAYMCDAFSRVFPCTEHLDSAGDDETGDEYTTTSAIVAVNEKEVV